jgi:hypothetical protein
LFNLKLNFRSRPIKTESAIKRQDTEVILNELGTFEFINTIQILLIMIPKIGCNGDFFDEEEDGREKDRDEERVGEQEKKKKEKY